MVEVRTHTTHHTVQSIKLDILRMGKNFILSLSHSPQCRAAGVAIRRIHLASLALRKKKEQTVNSNGSWNEELI